MRKRMAFHILAILIALSVGTLALPAPSGATPSSAAAAAPQARGPITVQRLLSDRIDWALRLARRVLDPNVVTRGGFDIESITDEPDPVGITRDPDQDPQPGDEPEPEPRDDEQDNGGEDRIRALGP
jgi:hypothetical protein